MMSGKKNHEAETAESN